MGTLCRSAVPHARPPTSVTSAPASQGADFLRKSERLGLEGNIAEQFRVF